MCIWNKILVGLISVASIVLFYMAAKALKIETTWSESAQKHEKKLKQIEQENLDLVEGTGQQPGIRQLRVDLHKVLLDRRRMWTNCDPKIKLAANGLTAEVTVVFAQPTRRVANNVVLCAFEEADVQNKKSRGQYIGEFTVKSGGKIDDTAIAQVTLEPTGRLSPREAEKLKMKRSSWVLYEVMPHDNHDAFASLSDDQKKAMLPVDGIEEYVRDGTPTAKGDSDERVVGGKFMRQLIDYDIVLTDERDKRILLDDAIEATKRDSKLVEAALVQARDQEEAFKRDIHTTEEDLKKMSHERDVVATLHANLQKSLETMQAWITRLEKKNREIAGQIAKYQLEAAQRIDERTRGMAQSGAGIR
jgi:hypothetical protein